MVAGWVYDFDVPDGWLLSESPLSIGEEIDLVIQGDLQSVKLRSRIVEVDHTETRNRRHPIFLPSGLAIKQPVAYYYRFEMLTPMRPVSNRDLDRKIVVPTEVRVSTPSQQLVAVLADVSENGARLLAPTPIEGCDLLEFRIEVDGQELEVLASSRYSRKAPGHEELFAVGLHFEKIGRIDAARWRKILAIARSEPARIEWNGPPEDSSVHIPVQADFDLRTIANKLLAKIQEVDRAEREYLLTALMLRSEEIDAEEMARVEAKLAIMERHKRQFAENLASTIEVMHAKIHGQAA